MVYLTTCCSQRVDFAKLPYAARDATLTSYFDSTSNRSFLYYFGGLCGVHAFSTLYKIDIHDQSATFVAIATLDPSVYARSEHAAAILESKNNRLELIVIGGYNPKVRLTQQLDPVLLRPFTWIRLT